MSPLRAEQVSLIGLLWLTGCTAALVVFPVQDTAFDTGFGWGESIAAGNLRYVCSTVDRTFSAQLDASAEAAEIRVEVHRVNSDAGDVEVHPVQVASTEDALFPIQYTLGPWRHVTGRDDWVPGETTALDCSALEDTAVWVRLYSDFGELVGCAQWIGEGALPLEWIDPEVDLIGGCATQSWTATTQSPAPPQ